MTQSVEPRPLTCVRCGAAFSCGVASGTCWCLDEEFRLPMPPADGAAECLCPSCLRAHAKAMPATSATR